MFGLVDRDVYLLNVNWHKRNKKGDALALAYSL